jgi:alkanesulfonate monooxygenase SsuD/methylene tetrahydromethanopterin reductase-like flavin-dependent oxidoreductase (luciferase family)
VWSLPAVAPPLFGAAVSASTARVVGSWADGLITVNQDPVLLRRVIDAFRDGGGEGKPVHVQVHLSWADDEDTALSIAHDQWRTNVFGSELMWDLELPSQFDSAAEHVQPQDLCGPVLVSPDTDRHIAWVEEIAALGVDGVYLHHVGREQQRFIDVFGERVLPEIAR